MKNKIKKIINGGWILLLEAFLCFIFALQLIVFPEYISNKTILVIGFIFLLEGIKVFKRWLNEDDKDVNNVEIDYEEIKAYLIRQEELDRVKERVKKFDGGDDFKTFKAENGIID